MKDCRGGCDAMAASWGFIAALDAAVAWGRGRQCVGDEFIQRKKMDAT